MSSRSLLGPAEPTDERLRAMVADQLGHAPGEVNVLDVEVEEVAYDIPAITTAARWWVRGTAATPGGETPYSLFVKQVQAWER